jgi:hypothetical protein
MMRNRGYMKGPAGFKCLNDAFIKDGGTINSRMSAGGVRKILGIFEFTETKSHKFRVKASTGGADMEFMGDYIEFVPTELIETEDTY